jgi:cadmium resistance protein CadD (predicted permease)
MESFVALLSLGIALFASTNVDDVFVLIGFLSDPTFRARDVVLGQYLGIAALFCVSATMSLLSLLIPRAYVGLLGVVPILIGMKKLYDLYCKRDPTEESLERHAGAGANGRALTVAIVTLANGGDNIGVYAPSFAIRSGNEIALIGLIFAVMTGLWCFLAHWTVNHPKLGSPIRRYGHRISPIVLIALGVLLLYQAGSFGLLSRGRF